MIDVPYTLNAKCRLYGSTRLALELISPGRLLEFT